MKKPELTATLMEEIEALRTQAAKLEQERSDAVDALEEERANPGRIGSSRAALIVIALLSVVYGSWASWKDERATLAAIGQTVREQQSFATGTATLSSGASTKTATTADAFTFETVKHSLEIHLAVPCWLKVTQQTPSAKVLIEGSEPAGFNQNFTSDEQVAVEVRAGCPGSLSYTVNGKEEHPVNKSGKPKESEVVDLLL